MISNRKGPEEQEQRELRERINPKWKEQLEQHRMELGIGPQTKALGAREIIKRAMKLNYGYVDRAKKKGSGIERWFS